MLLQQQLVFLFLHHAVKTLVVDCLQPHQSARAVHQGTGAAVAVRRQRGDLGQNSIDQNGVSGPVEALHRPAVNPIHRPRQPQGNVRARYAKSRTNRFHWSSLPNKGECCLFSHL